MTNLRERLFEHYRCLTAKPQETDNFVGELIRDVCELREALEEASTVIDFCYMSMPKNKHQIAVEQALSASYARLKSLGIETEHT